MLIVTGLGYMLHSGKPSHETESQQLGTRAQVTLGL